MRRIAAIFASVVLACAAASAQVDARVPDGIVQVIDDFENGNFWIWAGSDWDKYGTPKVSVGADLAKRGVSEGKYSMELLLEPVREGNEAVWFYDGSQDLSGGKYIVADFYNPYPVEHKISFAIQATDSWLWLQSDEYVVPQGRHTVVFDVEEINANFNDVKRINITSTVLNSYGADFSLYVDNIRLIK